MRRVVLAFTAAAVVLAGGAMSAAVQYPLTLTLDAVMKSGVTTISSKITVQVDRAMDDTRRTRVSDALKFGGYQNFYNALRGVPSVGSIQTQNGKVDVRYTREDPDGTATRLVLVSDQPLFYLGADSSKKKVGFELTVVNLRIEPQGAVTGQLSGAARVRPAPDGGVLLDTWAEELVELKGQAGKP